MVRYRLWPGERPFGPSSRGPLHTSNCQTGKICGQRQMKNGFQQSQSRPLFLIYQHHALYFSSYTNNAERRHRTNEQSPRTSCTQHKGRAAHTASLSELPTLLPHTSDNSVLFLCARRHVLLHTTLRKHQMISKHPFKPNIHVRTKTEALTQKDSSVRTRAEKP